MNQADLGFDTMGGRGRVVLASPSRSQAELDALGDAVLTVCDDVETHLSRFDPDSELSRFNRGEQPAGSSSELLRRLALAARWAGETTDGLVDATLLGELRRSDAPRAVLADALAAAPERGPARGRAARAYETLRVSQRGEVRRAAGVGLDSGGLAKGLAADLAAELMPADVRYAISVCGDLAVGGGAQQIVVEPAAPGGTPVTLTVGREKGACPLFPGGVATSGIGARLWQRADGTYAHHLLDPSTGEPAWTGLVAVTAVAGGALAAEVLAKHALLAGPRAARRLLRRAGGGVLQHEDGTLEPVVAAPVVRLKVPA
jgi:thiamine biosynthesis lipoprotein